jgi:hypothetical protein
MMATDFPSLEGMSAEDITRLAAVAQTVLTHPTTRTDAQRLVKKLDPTAAFPELDIDDRLNKQQEKFMAELDRRDKEEAARRATESRERSLQNLVQSGLRPEDVAIDKDKKVAPIEQFMLDNKISDYASAARLYRLSQAPAEAQSTSFQPAAGTPQLPTIDLTGTNLNQWSRDTAFQTWNDLHAGKLKVNEMGVPIN